MLKLEPGSREILDMWREGGGGGGVDIFCNYTFCAVSSKKMLDVSKYRTFHFITKSLNIYTKTRLFL